MRNYLVIAMLAAVLALPYLLKPKDNLIEDADVTLVVVSPHTEAIRYEFASAFRKWYKAKTGKTVSFDWRSIGGTSEIGRYVGSEYMGAFQNYWVNELKQPWSTEVANGFNNRKQKPGDDTPAARARKAFLGSNVGIGIDLFFGGGSFDHSRQGQAGHFVDAGIIDKHPELFNPRVYPQALSGEEFWGKDKTWIGLCFSAFGVVYNTDSLRRLGYAEGEFPNAWADLADPRLFRQVALADPTMSGSAVKAFEMLIQQQMHDELKRLTAGGMELEAAKKQAVEAGWNNGFNLIMKISANSRYFTDSASKIPMDVAGGNAAAGMAIDFYGRYQSEVVQKEDGSSRVIYLTPPGGSSVGVDPIGLFRGAPNAEVAKEFIEFCLTPEGQKLWNWKPGTPGGPERYALRRLPVLPALYTPDLAQYRSDPTVLPYEEAKSFTYEGAWTGPYFSSIAFVIKGMCLENHHDLQETWAVLRETGFPAEAMAELENLGPAGYAEVTAKLRPVLDDPDKIKRVAVAREFTDYFRNHYRKVRDLAHQHAKTAQR
jgi:ABC-type Fe3+ transport system substrate-binding protein